MLKIKEKQSSDTGTVEATYRPAIMRLILAVGLTIVELILWFFYHPIAVLLPLLAIGGLVIYGLTHQDRTRKYFGISITGTGLFSKNRYETERAYEKQSYIRLRGRFWYQLLAFLLYVVGGITLAILVGTFANAIWYILRVGLLSSFLRVLGVETTQTFSWDYLKQYVGFSISGGVAQDTSWVVWLLMLIVFGLILRLGIRNWYDWVQKFNSRTTNQNRWADLREIDRTYVLIPDRNKFYKGEAGQPITHISGYSIQFAMLHPLLWIWQCLKGIFGLNQEEFSSWYMKLRNKLLKSDRWAKHFKDQVTVKGGFGGFYWIDTTPTHALTTGATRSGKDERRGYVFIDILRRSSYELRPNIIDTDAKNEDAKMSFKALKAAGYDVQLLNIADPDWSESWNPFQVALNYMMDGELDKARDEAMVIVQIIGSSNAGEGGNDIWDKTAEDTQLAIILILLWLAMEHNDETLATPAGVPQFINSVNQFNDPKDKNLDGLTQYFHMLRQLDPMPPIINEAILKAGSYLGATGDTKSSVMFTLQSRSSLFASETVARLTSRSTIHISDYGFPRMLKVTVPTEYAGTTALIELYDRESKQSSAKYLEQDSVKVSRSGLIQFPFHQYFPDEWGIRITFDDGNNPVHLRNSWVAIPGERRFQRNFDRSIKVDPDSQQPLKKTVTLQVTSDLAGGAKPIINLRYSESPKAMFIVTPQSNDNYAAIASLFLGQVFSINTQIASDITRRKMDRRIIYKLNEFSMFPRIPGFDNFLTRGLTYGHIVDMYVQDDVQLTKHYAEAEATEIMNNMMTQFHILSKDVKTNEEVSKRLGEIEVQKELVNSQMGTQQQDRGNRQLSIDKVPLMSPKELAELNDGEMIVIRLAKRQDKKFRRVRALPIMDTGITMMPNRRDLIGETYRLDYYTTDLRIKNNTKHLSYEDIFQDYTPYFSELREYVLDEDDSTDTSNEPSMTNDVSDPAVVPTIDVNSQFTGADQGAAVQTVQLNNTGLKVDEFEAWISGINENEFGSFIRSDIAPSISEMHQLVGTFLEEQQLTEVFKKTFELASNSELFNESTSNISYQKLFELFNGDKQIAFKFYKYVENYVKNQQTLPSGGTADEAGDLPF
ncbi:type IV secretory system conjugative DNA transfer family protein [uncultured Weissella sp.]|uniref:type IV secretory system conjugative DNA transfer family protein n=1 Tax=uncultured Weissella sp. TaxID=253243 RepID=UPI00258DB2D9|nr:type IV secretory system conjugative DNA transfer family protein [uncultured Weissella sp.]